MNTLVSFEQGYWAAFMVQQLEENQAARLYTLQLDVATVEFLAWEGDDKVVISRLAAQSGLVLQQATPADYQVVVNEENGRSRLFQLTRTNWLALAAWQQSEPRQATDGTIENLGFATLTAG